MNSAKRGLLHRSAFLCFCFIFTLAGCFENKTRTYSISLLESSISSILQQEYEVPAVVKRVGGSLWIYLPLPVLFEKSDKPEDIVQNFAILRNDKSLSDGKLTLDYSIRKTGPNKKQQDMRMNRESAETINHAWEAVRRVLFSMDRKEAAEISFLTIVAGDIKMGLEISQTFYCEDIKKVTYRYISPGEYQRRASFGSSISPEIIGDTQGNHVDFRDIRMDDFIADQIQYRINLKFQETGISPEADIDKEIEKIVFNTVGIYGFPVFSSVELNNLETKRLFTLDGSTLVNKR